MDAQSTYIHFSLTEAIFSGEHTTQVFWWTLFKENWAMVLYHLISIFIDSRSLTKNSEGYPLLKVVHLAFWLFKLVSMDFSSILSSSMDFLSMKLVYLQCLCLILIHLAFPSVKWFWFLFHHWWRQFPWNCFDGTQFRELSLNRVQVGWFQIDSIGFHGFFSNWNDIHGSLFNETDLQGIFYTNFFFSFMDFPSTDFPLKDVQSVEKAFFSHIF